jgi:fatty-acyl-CoA synthase
MYLDGIQCGRSGDARSFVRADAKSRIARFKAPDTVEFVDALPKTSTGKIQKYVLREKERAGR